MRINTLHTQHIYLYVCWLKYNNNNKKKKRPEKNSDCSRYRFDINMTVIRINSVLYARIYSNRSHTDGFRYFIFSFSDSPDIIIPSASFYYGFYRRMQTVTLTPLLISHGLRIINLYTYIYIGVCISKCSNAFLIRMYRRQSFARRNRGETAFVRF